MTVLRDLREATVEDVDRALEGHSFPEDSFELLELFNRMLDVLAVPDEEAGTCSLGDDSGV